MDIVDRIDLILDLKKEKRQDLADFLGITYQAIGNWKKKNGYPVADTAIKIAGYLQVELSWLINGEIYFDKRYACTPKDIANRIISKLQENPKHPNDIPHLLTPITAWVSTLEFINWFENRKIPEIEILISIAKELEMPLELLITGNAEKPQTPNEHLMKIAKTYPNFLMTYDAMYETDKKYIDRICRRLFKLRRQVEGYDYAIPRDPNNPNLQADPNDDV